VSSSVPVKESGLSRKRVKAAGLTADELERALVNALSGGNGRPGRVRDEAELIGYLAADGVVDLDYALFWSVLGALIKAGRVARRPGYGLWLSNGMETLTGSDWTRVDDIEKWFS
jgi:hypothetical protein